MASCMLSMLADPQLKGVLPGLVYNEPWIQLDPSQLGCCDGTGQRFIDGQNTTRHCDLNWRRRRLSELIGRYRATFAEGCLVSLLQQQTNPSDLARLASCVSGGKNPGDLGSQARGMQLETPQSVWVVAFMAVWRFGFNVIAIPRVAVGACPDLPKILPRNRQSMIIVGEAAELWDVRALSEFEMIVDFAYGATLPLWFSSPPPPPSTRVKTRLEKRVGEIHRQQIDSFLSPSCSRKLGSICQVSRATNAAGSSRHENQRRRPRSTERSGVDI